MPLVLPESVEAARINAEIDSQVNDQIEEATRWNRELKRIDESLSLVWSPPQADDTELRPGRFMIRKRVSGSVDAFIPLEGPEGQYREPGPWMLEMLAANDMWSDRRRHEREEIKRKLGESKRRAEQTEREARWDEATLAMRAAGRLRDPMGFEKRSDLKASPETLAHRKKLAERRTERGEKQ